MVIHGGRDESFRSGRRGLYDAASFPKQPMWLPSGKSQRNHHDDYAADAVLEFFDTVRPMRAI